MAVDVTPEGGLAWLGRLSLPTYSVAEAARYARISTSTVCNWHYGTGVREPLLTEKRRGAELSYLQLVEMAFVASFRRAGVSLPRIRRAREYLRAAFKTDYPFSSVRLKTEGRSILLNLTELEPLSRSRDLVSADRKGQIGWVDFIADRVREFDYLRGLAITWHLAGRGSPVSIDPRYAFGFPAVRGVATWSIRARFEAREPVEFIADDVGLDPEEVRRALEFERIRVPQ